MNKIDSNPNRQTKPERGDNWLMKKGPTKKNWIAKTTYLVLTMLLLSLLVPVLASAAMTFQGSFASDGTISGPIRFDGDIGQAVYGKNEVTVGVYGSNGEFIQNLTVTRSAYDEAASASIFTIPSTVIPSVYSAVYFVYGGEQTPLIYRDSGDSDDGSSGGDDGSGSGSEGNDNSNGNNGDGSEEPGNVSDTIDANADGSVDADLLKAALAKYKIVTIRVPGDAVSIPASALVGAAFGSQLNIETDHGKYLLPLGSFDLADLARKAQSDVADLKIDVSIVKLTGNEADAVSEAVHAIGGKPLSAAYELTFAVVGKSGSKTAIDNFEQYVKRIIPLEQAPSKTATIALYDPKTGKLSFVPGTITSTEAEFWRTGNSIYTVLELDKTFDDIRSHWAQSDIELLAAKLIVEGATDDTFEPERKLTRAEFVALATRAFGLVEVNGVTYFDDVKLGNWYSGMIAAAAKAGLINGYEDGTFRPDASITREEIISIIVRAYRYAGGDVSVDTVEQSRLLAQWDDADRIVWAHKDVAKALKAGFLKGMTDDELQTYDTATRAQTVAFLKRVLSKLAFIEE